MTYIVKNRLSWLREAVLYYIIQLPFLYFPQVGFG